MRSIFALRRAAICVDPILRAREVRFVIKTARNGRALLGGPTKREQDGISTISFISARVYSRARKNKRGDGTIGQNIVTSTRNSGPSPFAGTTGIETRINS